MRWQGIRGANKMMEKIHMTIPSQMPSSDRVGRKRYARRSKFVFYKDTIANSCERFGWTTEYVSCTGKRQRSV
ncbi:hypothetical protein AG1IA_08279 [Rhizoctonia solani AG-1 IA]|uniref:Uncharacterized protein n=1 Tax=Thanatephorus cucumeris (strain AG1-IA) TaxID=983506 RepID=L8WIF4_THACA|nr:hypothetical protein AG1IA_08279 [Rhizoctonia solani AG-1 IA]